MKGEPTTQIRIPSRLVHDVRVAAAKADTSTAQWLGRLIEDALRPVRKGPIQ